MVVLSAALTLAASRVRSQPEVDAHTHAHSLLIVLGPLPNFNARFGDRNTQDVGFELNQYYTAGPMANLLVASHTGFTGTKRKKSRVFFNNSACRWPQVCHPNGRGHQLRSLLSSLPALLGLSFASFLALAQSQIRLYWIRSWLCFISPRLIFTRTSTEKLGEA